MKKRTLFAWQLWTPLLVLGFIIVAADVMDYTMLAMILFVPFLVLAFIIVRRFGDVLNGPK